MHKITTNQQLEEGKWKIKWKRREEGRSEDSYIIALN
jgi:hypothetical protein